MNNSKITKTKRRFTIEFKMKIVLFYESLQQNVKAKDKSINLIARISEIDRRVLSRWIKNKDSLSDVVDKRHRTKCEYKSDRSICPEMESRLYEWIINQRLKGACLSSVEIRNKGIEFYNFIHSNDGQRICELPKVDFKASDGWFLNFCRRKKLTLRRITSSGRDLPSNCIEQINSFFEDVSNIIKDNQLTLSQILNMDETCTFLDANSNFCLII